MAQDVAALARRWFEEVWNKGRREAIDEMWDENCVAHGLLDGGADIQGRDAFKALQTRLRGAFPDLHIEVEDVIADGDRTAMRICCTGTHLGDHLGIPPTGKKVAFTGMTIARWRDGKIVEGWNNVDMAGMMRQIGGV
jgi:steroid delta-isomerase-like uncharacterized protein